MLKVLSSSGLGSRLRHFSPRLPTSSFNGEEERTAVKRVLGYLSTSNCQNPVFYPRAFFCSESNGGDGGGGQKAPDQSGLAEEVEAESTKASEGGISGGEVDGKSSSAIVSTNPRPEDHLTVRYNLFLGIIYEIYFLSCQLPLNCPISIFHVGLTGLALFSSSCIYFCIYIIILLMNI